MTKDQRSGIESFIITFSSYRKEFRRYRVVLIIILILALVGGYIYSKYQDDKYEATLKFMVKQSENDNSPGNNIINGLAGTIGVNLGLSSSFSTENVVEILQTRDVISATLLNECVIDKKKDLFLNHYIRINDFNVNQFTSEDTSYLKDSIINIIYQEIIDDKIKIVKSKNSSIVTISYFSRNQEFAKYFTDSIEAEMMRVYDDAIRGDLKRSLNRARNEYKLATNEKEKIFKDFQDLIDDLSHVSKESVLIEKMLYEYELSRVFSRYNTSKVVLDDAIEAYDKTEDIIQVIDRSVLPLDNKKREDWFWMVTFSFLSLFLSCFVIVIRKLIKDTLSANEVINN